jgi:signal transduction histidine kinase
MEQNPQQALEELIHRELSKLGERPAPATLIPRVLAQIQARSRRHWWRCPWYQWPLALQVLSAPVLLAGMLAAVFGLSVTWKFLMGYSDFGTVWDTLDSVLAGWDLVEVLGNAVFALGRYVGTQWLLVALTIPLAMYLACVGLGTLCYRMAVAKR